MKKRFIILIACLIIFSANIFAENVTGERTFQKVLLNGQEVKVGSYLINERNYVKLRDMAALLNGTGSQFNVDWDEATGNVIVMTGSPYSKLAGDLSPLTGGKITGQKGNINLLLNGQAKQIETVLINENNYLQLRQLGSLIGLGVDWDEATGAILLATGSGENIDLLVDDNKDQKSIINDGNDSKDKNYISLAGDLISPSEGSFNFASNFAIGSTMPKFTVDMIDGSENNISLGRLIKDKIQIYNFFQSSCSYCVSEMSDLAEANKRADVDVIAVSLDQDLSEVKRLFDANGWKLPVFKATSGYDIVAAYSVKTVPHSVFTKNGQALGVFKGALTKSQIDFIVNELSAGKNFLSDNEIQNH